VTTARAPASSANLGPGFDALAVALSIYVEVTITPADALRVTVEGEGESDYPLDSTHPAVRIASRVAAHERLAIHVKSDIPLGRGLGSSAAFAAAVAAAAGAADPLAVAAETDGHPENAAASVLGGLVAATTIDGAPVARRLVLDPELTFVVLVPAHELPTKAARAALAPTVTREHAAFNLGRLGLLIAGLADRRQLLAAAAEDRLHQDARTHLFPEAPALILGLREAGALAACWSGAGPSILGICDRATAESVRAAGLELLTVNGVRGDARLVEPDVRGLIVER